MPNKGKKEHKTYTNSIPYMSATSPRIAEATPAIPKANPKKIPETSPTLNGKSSCAETRIAENADDSISPTLLFIVRIGKIISIGTHKSN